MEPNMLREVCRSNVHHSEHIIGDAAADMMAEAEQCTTTEQAMVLASKLADIGATEAADRIRAYVA